MGVSEKKEIITAIAREGDEALLRQG